jgi:hypothetical protein
VGIGLTWDAEAVVVGNLVTRYWKGIGVFVDARAEVRENLVADMVTWGLTFWAAGRGAPRAVFEGNAVVGTGSCGAMIDGARVAEGAGEAEDAEAAGGAGDAENDPDPAPGAMVGNAFVRTGMNEKYDAGDVYCPQRPIARVAVPAGFVVEGNHVLDVRQPGPWPLEPVAASREAFAEAVAPLLRALEAHPPLRGAEALRALRP